MLVVPKADEMAAKLVAYWVVMLVVPKAEKMAAMMVDPSVECLGV